MKHPFKVGDPVICVKRRGYLIDGQKYLVTSAHYAADGITPMISVDHNTEGFYAKRFELYDPNAAMIAADGDPPDPVLEEDEDHVIEDEALVDAVGKT